jgi:hypothetical protein
LDLFWLKRSFSSVKRRPREKGSRQASQGFDYSHKGERDPSLVSSLLRLHSSFTQGLCYVACQCRLPYSSSFCTLLFVC